MRDIPSEVVEALTGSRSGDRLECWLWYDGGLAHPEPLNIASWGLSWDGSDSKKTQGTLSLEVVDNTGELAPWLFDDPLGVGGSQIQAIYHVGGLDEIAVGWYRITSTDSDEQWRTYQIREDGHIEPDTAPHTRLVMVSGGATIAVEAEELTVNADLDKLLAPEAPPVGATVLSEVRRLLRDIIPVVTAPGVADEAVPEDVVYERERMEAVMDLIASIDCWWRMDGAGALEIYPLSERTPRWLVRGGPDGALIRVPRSMSIDGLHNIAVTDGQEGETPVRGIWMVDSGPLRADGPHGRVPVFYQSSLITNQTAAVSHSRGTLEGDIAARAIDLPVECLPHPGLQTGDWVTLATPRVDGETLTVDGQILSMKLSGSTAVDPMSMTVRCTYGDVKAAFSQSSLRKYQTNQKPDPMWDLADQLWDQANRRWG